MVLLIIQSKCQIERSHNNAKRFTEVSSMCTYLCEPQKEARKLKLGEGGHGGKCTFLVTEDSVLNDLPALTACASHRVTARSIHTHPKTSGFFAPNSHWRSQQKSSSIFPLGSSLVSHPSFCGSLLWIPPTSFLPAFFFLFTRRELTSAFRSVADIAGANTYPVLLSSRAHGRPHFLASL